MLLEYAPPLQFSDSEDGAIGPNHLVERWPLAAITNDQSRPFSVVLGQFFTTTKITYKRTELNKVSLTML